MSRHVYHTDQAVRRAKRSANAAAKLTAAGIPHEVHQDGQHITVDGRFDYYPHDVYWMDRMRGSSRRGIQRLIDTARQKISMIVACDLKGGIGQMGITPWHIAEDLQRFKALTAGSAVLMGRKTFEAIGRPLPGRTNYVLSRAHGFAPDGVAVLRNLHYLPHDQDLWVIGGGEVYKQLLPYVSRLEVTLVRADYLCDTFFECDYAAFGFTETEHVNKNGPLCYDFISYRRTV